MVLLFSDAGRDAPMVGNCGTARTARGEKRALLRQEAASALQPFDW